MSTFWNEELNSGYYDKILESGLKKGNSIQANWHNITFLKLSSYTVQGKEHLDYACGPGTFVGKYSDANSIGVDISSNQIKYAINKYGDKKFLTLEEFNQVSYKEEFDIISIMGLFEFLTNKEILELLDSLYDLLKPGGKIVSSTLNFKSFLRVLLFFQGKLTKVDYRNLHINKFSLKALDKTLKQTRFQKVQITKFLTIGVAFSIFSNKFGIKCDKFIEKIFNNYFGFLLFIELDK